MIKTNLEDNIHWQNKFIPKYYISQAIGSAGMILGQEKPDNPKLKLDFGQYCQVYENTRIGMTPWSVGIIETGTKDDIGSYYFMSLKTGRRINAREWTVLHVTEFVTYRVEQLDIDEGINEMMDREILF